MTCAFCGVPLSGAFALSCTWPVLKFQRTTYGLLVPGDKVRRISEKRDLAPAVVVDVHAIDDSRLLLGEGATIFKGLPVALMPEYLVSRVMVTIQLTPSRQRTIELYRRSPVLVQREAPCGKLCCSNCRVERGDRERGTYCRDHWFAWEAVA